MKLTKPQVLNHKKFQVGIATTLGLLFTQLGPALAESATFWIALGSITLGEWLLIIGPILTAIGAQGFADIGKESAKIKTILVDDSNVPLEKTEEQKK